MTGTYASPAALAVLAGRDCVVVTGCSADDDVGRIVIEDGRPLVRTPQGTTFPIRAEEIGDIDSDFPVRLVPPEWNLDDSGLYALLDEVAPA